MRQPNYIMSAAQTPSESRAFIEAFAKVTVRHIGRSLSRPLVPDAAIHDLPQLDWDDQVKLKLSGVAVGWVNSHTRDGHRFLHIDAAISKNGYLLRTYFLGLTGLSEKQQRALFPMLRSKAAQDEVQVSAEVIRLNAWLDEMGTDGFDSSAFVAYQRAIGIHGQTQNLSGAIGAAGAVVAFVDAIRELTHNAIQDTVGELPPATIRSPSEVYDWLVGAPDRTVKAILLTNGRAIVFASSKDANIFEPLGREPFLNANDALRRFNAVSKNQRNRSQRLHEHAVGEVKTATDPANLHERMGLASRETQTELRTDRFLLMALLNGEILSGGTQGRVMNNKDLTRFSHVFNLHHCWGWDGGRERNPEHWNYFKDSVREWCGL